VIFEIPKSSTEVTCRAFLVVTSDITVAAAVCAALHGASVTVCDTVDRAARELTAAEAFDVVLCEASLAVIELLVRVQRQPCAVRIAFLATSEADQELANALCGTEAFVVSPGDEARLHALVHGR
jgi:hypothetical protein